MKELSNIGQSLQTVRLAEKAVKIAHLYQPLSQEYLKISNILISISHGTWASNLELFHLWFRDQS